MSNKEKLKKPEEFSVNLVLNDLRDIVENRMMCFTDKQNGKGELKELIKKYENYLDEPIKLDLCSYCGNPDVTVDRNLFDGLCAPCTSKSLYNDEIRKIAARINKGL